MGPKERSQLTWDVLLTNCVLVPKVGATVPATEAGRGRRRVTVLSTKLAKCRSSLHQPSFPWVRAKIAQVSSDGSSFMWIARAKTGWISDQDSCSRSNPIKPNTMACLLRIMSLGGLQRGLVGSIAQRS